MSTLDPRGLALGVLGGLVATTIATWAPAWPIAWENADQEFTPPDPPAGWLAESFVAGSAFDRGVLPSRYRQVTEGYQITGAVGKGAGPLTLYNALCEIERAFLTTPLTIGAGAWPLLVLNTRIGPPLAEKTSNWIKRSFVLTYQYTYAVS